MHTYVYIFMTVIVFNSVLLTLNPCVNKTFFLFFCLFEIPFLSICLNLSKFCRTEAVETHFFLKLSRIRSDALDPFRCLEPIQIPWTRLVMPLPEAYLNGSEEYLYFVVERNLARNSSNTLIDFKGISSRVLV